MPGTVKFSEKFYERFGHELVEELVNHLDFVDHAYRTELRELNELNFARFDAKIEQRAMQLEMKIDRMFGELDEKIHRTFGELDKKIDQRGEKLDTKWEQQFAKFDSRFTELRGDMKTEIACCKSDLIKWMFVFWAGTTVTLIGTMIALVN